MKPIQPTAQVKTENEAMAYLSQGISDRITRNDLDIDVARDLKEPFREETRKAKRNLVTFSFAAILISALDVQVNSFAGISASSGSVATDLTRGLACLAVIYFLVAYAMDALLDYTAWKIEIKRLTITPYLLLIRSVERSFRSSSDQLKNVAWTFNHLSSLPDSIRTEPISSKNHSDALGQLPAIEKHQREVMEEIRPLLARWEKTLRNLSFQTSGRRVARAARIWCWDFMVPLLLTAVAICRTCDGLSTTIPKLLGLPA